MKKAQKKQAAKRVNRKPPRIDVSEIQEKYKLTAKQASFAVLYATDPEVQGNTTMCYGMAYGYPIQDMDTEGSQYKVIARNGYRCKMVASVWQAIKDLRKQEVDWFNLYKEDMQKSMVEQALMGDVQAFNALHKTYGEVEEDTVSNKLADVILNLTKSDSEESKT